MITYKTSISKLLHTRTLWLLSTCAVVAITAVFLIWFFGGFASNSRPFASLRQTFQYCNTIDHAQSLDLYRPKNSTNQKQPLLIYIHGGGWRSGSNRNPFIMNTYGKFFIEHGMAVASIEYRLNPAHPYPDQNNDIACALAYIDANASSLGIDSGKTIFLGESAGGELAAFAALNIPYRNYDYEAPLGVIDFYGVSDFSKIVIGSHPDFNARRYLGSKYNQVAASASPTTYVTKKAPRFLFFHGTKDGVVPISQSRALSDQLTSLGIDTEYVSIPGARHGFAGPELSASNNNLIISNLNSFLQETIQH